jgi:NLR family CARD domain-containing protein 3
MDQAPPPTSPTSGPRGVRLRVLTLMAMVACCASLLWAWRRVVREPDPAFGLARALRDGDVERRRAAVVDLRQLPPELARSAVAALFLALRDADPVTRAEAASTLAYILPAELRPGQRRDGAELRAALEALVAAAGDPHAAVRKAAVEALGSLARTNTSEGVGQCPAFVVEAVARGSKDDDPEVREVAVVALGGDDWRTDAALSALRAGTKDRSPRVRVEAVRSLSRFQDADGAAMGIIAALRDDDRDVRQAAAIALKSVGRLPDAAIPILIAALRDSKRSHLPITSVLMALERAGPRARAAAPILVELVSEDALAGRALGAVAPGSPEARKVAETLVRELRSGQRGRNRGASAFLALDLLRLIDALATDRRQQVADALSTFAWDTDLVVPALRDAARNDESQLVREQASRVLREWHGPITTGTAPTPGP